MSGKPYFGFALYARQGLFDRHRYFLPLIKALHTERNRPIRILEVGSWAGASAISWAKGLEAARVDGSVLCIDRWAPYFDTSNDTQPVYREMNAAAESGDILKLFQHNIKACGVDGHIEYRCASSHDALPELPRGSFDLIFLDGAHSYREVRFDVQESTRLIADGGIIVGDDLELQRNKLTISEHLDAVASRRDYVWSQANECSYHPGVTEAVAEFFGEVATWNGLWAVRKQGSTWARVQLNVEETEIPQHLAEDIKADQQDDASSEDRTVELIDETERYNLVRAGSKFLAVAKSLGPVDLFNEKIGERPLGDLILVGGSLDEIRQLCKNNETIGHLTPGPSIELIEELDNYNLVRAGDQFLAVSKSLGPVNLFRERLGERPLGRAILVGGSLDEVRVQAVKKTGSAV